ncbi:hypothetical protein MKK82_25865, partial [Methylobacterium sp. E-046]|nr:hypothetical protein [Methylobacterium sp. E-046]
LPFTQRPKPAAPILPEPPARAALRASLEEAVQIAVDAADRIIAVLDSLDGDANDQGCGDADPSLAAPENVAGSQVVYICGTDAGRETDEP